MFRFSGNLFSYGPILKCKHNAISVVLPGCIFKENTEELKSCFSGENSAAHSLWYWSHNHMLFNRKIRRSDWRILPSSRDHMIPKKCFGYRCRKAIVALLLLLKRSSTHKWNFRFKCLWPPDMPRLSFFGEASTPFLEAPSFHFLPWRRRKITSPSLQSSGTRHRLQKIVQPFTVKQQPGAHG